MKYKEEIMRVIFGVLLVITVAIVINVKAEDPPKTKKDTVKVDTLTVQQQQVIYKKQMVRQKSSLTHLSDSLKKAKKK